MRKGFILALFALLFYPLQVQASLDLRLSGLFYSEIAQLPEKELQAGNRLKLYSELGGNSSSSFKLRLTALNQKEGFLNRYDQPITLYLPDLAVDWAEVRYKGKLLPAWPSMDVGLGNVEIDYSPYIIMIQDDILEDYSSYVDKRGLKFDNLDLLGFRNSGFILWGFENSSQNIYGYRFCWQREQTKLTGIMVDYGYRGSSSFETIMDKFEEDPDYMEEVEGQKVKAFALEAGLGKMGNLHLLWAVQDQKTFQRIDAFVVDKLNSISNLKLIEWKLPLKNNEVMTIGYQDFPLEFDPILRDRTPEFDPNTGRYLGYNPLDKYRDRVGFYGTLDINHDQLDLGIRVSSLSSHNELIPSNRYLTSEVSLLKQLGKWEVDAFSQYRANQLNMETWLRSQEIRGFTRLIVSYPIKRENGIHTSGVELWKMLDDQGSTNRIGVFYRYHTNYISADCGINQFLQNARSGVKYWMGIELRSQNGLRFRYRYSYPSDINNKQYMYDPDYRLKEPGNIKQLSIEVIF